MTTTCNLCGDYLPFCLCDEPPYEWECHNPLAAEQAEYLSGWAQEGAAMKLQSVYTHGMAAAINIARDDPEQWTRHDAIYAWAGERWGAARAQRLYLRSHALSKLPVCERCGDRFDDDEEGNGWRVCPACADAGDDNEQSLRRLSPVLSLR